MTRIYIPLGWLYGDLHYSVEAWKRGVDIGVCLNPNYAKRDYIDIVAASGLPTMVDNGAYQAYKKDLEPDWDGAVSIAEELESDYIVALDKIGSPEESLKTSLEVFGSTHIEKIVPLQAVCFGPANAKQIKKHLRMALDRGVRVFGIPYPKQRSNIPNRKFAINCRWIIPTRCHALGYPLLKKWAKYYKYFDSVDCTFKWMQGEGTVAEKLHEFYQFMNKRETPPLEKFVV